MGLPSLRNHEIRPFPRAQGPGASSQGLAGPAPGWAGWALGPGAQGYLILPQAGPALRAGWAGPGASLLGVAPGGATPIPGIPLGSTYPGPGPSHTTRARVTCARARARAPAE